MSHPETGVDSGGLCDIRNMAGVLVVRLAFVLGGSLLRVASAQSWMVEYGTASGFDWLGGVGWP